MKMTVRKRLSWAIYALMVVMVCVFGVSLTNARAKYEAAHKRALMWKDVVDHTPSGVVVTDDKGFIIAWNDGAEKMLGWEEDEVRDVHVNFLMTDDKLREQHEKLFVNSSELFDERVHRAVCWVPTKDGGTEQVRLRIVGFKNSHRCFLVTFERESDVAPLQHQKSYPFRLELPNLKLELRK